MSATKPQFELEQKLTALRDNIASLDSVLVAYSGGTDSGFLAYVAHQVLKDRMQAVIANSASLPRSELSMALHFAQSHGIAVHILQTHELDDPDYVRNDQNRCFHCKDELFTQMEAERKKLGFNYLAYGMNANDKSEFRPGQMAAALHRAVAPLAEVNLTKDEIRILARQAGLSLADKPASACLSSRIEYGRPVTAANLSQVERAEDALHSLGFAQVRVRHHGDIARIEFSRADLPRALSLTMFDQITVALSKLGFIYITVDTQGYRSGSMNDILPISAIQSAN